MQSVILLAGFEVYNSKIEVEYVFDEALLNQVHQNVTTNDFSSNRICNLLLFLH